MADKNTQTVKSGEIPVRGSEDAPFIFVDGYQGVATGNGVVRLRMTRARLADSPDMAPTAEVVCYLVMGAGALVAIHKGMGDLIESMKKQGDLPPDAGS